MASHLLLEGVGMTSRRTRDRLVQRLIEQGIKDPRVLEVIGNTPRHLFVDEALSHRAYEDTALPIGFKQTLSQPYIVAKMTEILLERAKGLDSVLEIGTGSGYQTTILAQLVERVFSVERIQPLQNRAKLRFRQLNIRNVTLKHSDGNWGWSEKAPYNGILSTAAPDNVPQSLLDQLSPEEGVLVLPVGGEKQTLQIYTRRGDDYSKEVLESVCFVPLLPGVVK